MNNIEIVRQQKATAIQTMKSLMERDGGKLTADEKQQYQKAEADWQTANESEKRFKDFQKMMAEQTEERAFAAEKEAQEKKDTPADVASKKKKAFIQYMKRGWSGVSRDLLPFVKIGDVRAFEVERRGTTAQKTTPDSSGGFLVDEILSSEVNLGQQFVSDMERACRVVLTDNGQPIKYPKIDDTGTDGAQATQAARDSADIAVSDMTVGATTLEAYLYTSLWVKLSVELLADIEYSLDSFLFPLLAARVNRAKNAALTTGDGSDKPNGIITSASLGVTAAVSSITHENLIDLFYSVDRDYRKSNAAAFMCNDAVEKAILKLGLTAAENFNPVVINPNNQELTIMGKPLYSNADMAATIEASAKTLLFGDFNQYVIRKTRMPMIRRTDEGFIKAMQVGFLAAERLDADFVGAVASIKYLQQAAS